MPEQMRQLGEFPFIQPLNSEDFKNQSPELSTVIRINERSAEVFGGILEDGSGEKISTIPQSKSGREMLWTLMTARPSHQNSLCHRYIDKAIEVDNFSKIV